MLRLSTPWITRMIVWHEKLMNKQYLVGEQLAGKDAPECSALSILGSFVGVC